MCGEHFSRAAFCALRIGSSPRVWGARPGGCAHDGRDRLIPTCVGSTCRRGKMTRLSAAHPHVCGEHLPNNRLDPLANGSSPRVWGAQLHRGTHRPSLRLIPTCVGSTCGVSGWRFSTSAHPHVCGEHFGNEDLDDLTGGSSPRVWGALIRACFLTRFCRLIPTCVGSTRSRGRHSTYRTAHPHVCGEHFCPRPVSGPVYGSSPRVWGALPGSGI